MIPLRQSTASQEVAIGPFLDETDAITPLTALSIANTDVKIFKRGATTLANKNSGGGTHISTGIYYITLDATDTNTLGELVIFCHMSGALPMRVNCMVYPANVFDSLFLGTDYLDVNEVQISGTASGGDSYNLITGANVELTSVPDTTASMQEMIQFLFEYFRNNKTVTKSLETLYKEDGTTALGTSALSDDGTTFTKGEMG